MNMPKFINKKTIIYTLSVILLLAATVALGVLFFYLNVDYALDSVAIEAGEDITLDLFFEKEVPEGAMFITDISQISTSLPGIYNVDYHSGKKERTALLTVSDTVFPVATLKENVEIFNGIMPLPEAFIGSSYDETTLEYYYVNTPEINGEGEYTIDVAVRDLGGNVIVLHPKFTMIYDNEPPVFSDITDLDTYVGLELDLLCGITVTDNIDKEPVISVNMESEQLANPGTYEVVYTATDKAGNKSEASCIVTVVTDTVCPEIHGVENITTAKGLEVDLLASVIASDNCDTAVALAVEGEVDFNTPGKYNIIYKATDFSGNTTSKKAKVTVVSDKKSPKISYADPIKIPLGQNFDIVKIASLEDDWDKNPKISFSGTVNTSQAGEYPITITATDFSGNSSEKNCSVVVDIDTTPPVITPKDITVVVGGTVSYRKRVVVSDDFFGMPKLTIDSSEVDLATIGEYTVNYTATDVSGNTATLSTTVKVVPPPPKKDLVHQMANKVVNGIIKDGMNDLEKLMAIYAWVNKNIRYAGTSDKSSIIDCAYEGFSKKKGDCYTFYCVAKIMLDIVGFENEEVSRDPATNSRHWWNLVKYNDKWYHFDTTRFKKGNGLLFMLTDEEVASWDKSYYTVGHKFIDENLPSRAAESIQHYVDYTNKKIIK